ncbi:MarR family winged helix-turn-helix transcriptional regulator [Pontivivens ytuae]|uniref:MarR family transcriptional regulator n=1 Tax=Pontivivens ytuae TaxID=2789856 RepID=A0A7S9LP97_9RHOB|nr:MarR family transcriptional regulator [Pontivivens ytuae]QPH52275.1 MarR family transcriptional regulator [Pontivivens ytuae]
MNDEDDLCDGVSALLKRVAHLNRVEGERILGECGFRGGQEYVMGALWEKDGQRPGDIAGRLGLSPAAVTKHVHNLANAGYLRTEADKEDRRASRIFLTQKGVSVRDRVGRQIRTLEADLLSPLSAEEVVTLKGLLSAILAFHKKQPD